MTTPAPNLFTGYSIDDGTEQALYTGSHQGLARNGATAETFSRSGQTAAAVALTSGNASYSAINLRRGQVITNITVVTNTTAAGTPTHAQVGLYSAAKAKVASSADLLTAAWAASSEITVPLSTPYTVLADGIYYVAVNVVASSTPTLTGVAGQAVLNALAPQIAFGDTTALTTALPATATVTAGASQFYAYTS